jgi:hypothetical protein
MNTAMKAALLSGLVIPGSGHLFLQHRRRGWLLIAVTLLAATVVVAAALRSARALADGILNGDIAPDPVLIAEQVHTAAHAAMAGPALPAAWVLLGCWLAGVVDAYRLGLRAPR